MVWPERPVLVTVITYGDGFTSCENNWFFITTKTAGKVLLTCNNDTSEVFIVCCLCSVCLNMWTCTI